MVNQESTELKEILYSTLTSLEKFGKVFYPEIFSKETHSLIRAIIDALESPYKKVCIAAPRGVGKTKWVLDAFVSRAILFELYNFVVYITNEARNAALKTEQLKMGLLSNEYITNIFGSIKPEKVGGEYEQMFSQQMWIANKTVIIPRGPGQQVRGLNYGKYRPDLIIFDDLEISTDLTNDENRLKLRTWFYADPMKCIDFYNKENYKFIYIDTLKHEDSLMQHLLDDPSWHSIRLEACDENLKSTAPDYMTDEEIREEYEIHERNGMTDVFYREFRNLPISTKDAVFKPEYFRYYELADIEHANIINFVIVDPAKTVKLQSADTAIIGVGIDTERKKVFIRELISGKMYPDELYENSFGMCARLNSYVLGVEVTSLEEFIKQPFEQYKRKIGANVRFVWLRPRGGMHKLDRIKQLAPYYRCGEIYHNKSCCEKLEKQLKSFPNSALLDCMDALSYIVELFELENIYFDVPNDDSLNNEDDYLELINDDVLTYEKLIGNPYGHKCFD